MKRILGTIVFVIYSIIAIIVTVLLLSYNDYNCSQLGEYTVLVITDDSLEPEYKSGSILIVKNTSDKNLQVGDEMLLYKVINSQEYEIVNKTLKSKAQQGRHITYTTTDDENYANDYFIGKSSDTIVIEGWGYLLSILESRWGYLFCIVIVSLLLFLQEMFELIMELKYGGGNKKKQSKKSSTTQPKTKAIKNIEENEIEEQSEILETEEIKEEKKEKTEQPKRTRSSSSKSTGTSKKTTTQKRATTQKTTKPRTTRKTNDSSKEKEE